MITADHRRQREFPGLDDDLHKLLVKSNATLVKSEEHLPQDDKEMLRREELKCCVLFTHYRINK